MGCDERHERDERPWGSYEVLAEGPEYKVKRIEVRSGQRLSYQRHARRAEHWYVVSGCALVLLDDVEYKVQSGEAIDIKVGSAHRVANMSDDGLVFIETQTGDYFGEDDIVRLDDDYGRIPRATTTAQPGKE